MAEAFRTADKSEGMHKVLEENRMPGDEVDVAIQDIKARLDELEDSAITTTVSEKLALMRHMLSAVSAL